MSSKNAVTVSSGLFAPTDGGGWWQFTSRISAKDGPSSIELSTDWPRDDASCIFDFLASSIMIALLYMDDIAVRKAWARTHASKQNADRPPPKPPLGGKAPPVGV